APRPHNSSTPWYAIPLSPTSEKRESPRLSGTTFTRFQTKGIVLFLSAHQGPPRPAEPTADLRLVTVRHPAHFAAVLCHPTIAAQSLRLSGMVRAWTESGM